MLVGILPLLVLGGIVALVVRAVGRRGGDGPKESGTVVLRRFFQYAVLLGLLVVVAIGLTGILEQILPAEGAVIRRDRSAIARSLSFLVVGIPVYLGVAAWIKRQLQDVTERASFGWSFYLTAALLTSLAVAAFAAFDILTWTFGAEPYDRASTSRLIIWGAIWVAHWFVADRYLESARGEGHLIAGSAGSLVAVASAVGFGVSVVLDALYSNLFETGVVSGFGDDIALAAAGAIVGGAIWWLYWLLNAHTLERSSLWHAHVMLVGVLGGLFAAIGSATTLLYTTLEWFLGDVSGASAAAQFDVLPALVGGGLVGGGVFFYHRAVLADQAGTARTEIRRIYEYVIAAVGLLGLATGLTILLVALLQQLVPASDVVAGESELNTLLGAVTALVVGGPLWWWFWSRIQRIRFADVAREVRSRTRRAYLALLFGIGGVTALVSLVVAVFAIFEDIFEGRFGGDTISDAAPAIALVLTTGAIAGYHWLAFKEDRAETPAAMQSPLKEVVLLGVDGSHLAARLSEELDVRVTQWDRLDVPGGPVEIARLAAELESAPYERVMVIAWEGGHRVVPFAATTTRRSTPAPDTPPPPIPID